MKKKTTLKTGEYIYIYSDGITAFKYKHCT